MPYCNNCGNLVTGSVCGNCGQQIALGPAQNVQQYPPPNLSAIAVMLLFVGVILLSCGVFAMAFVTDEITIGDFTTGDDQIEFGVELSGYKIGMILLGLGVLVEGLGSALATREHFNRLDALRMR
jgi:hypothetical protein